MFAGAALPALFAAEKKRRGRPRKLVASILEDSLSPLPVKEVSPSEPVVLKKPRGRPPKIIISEPIPNVDDEATLSSPPSVKQPTPPVKKRGRPRKIVISDDESISPPVKRPRLTEKKKQLPDAVVSPPEEKKAPKQPSKVLSKEEAEEFFKDTTETETDESGMETCMF